MTIYLGKGSYFDDVDKGNFLRNKRLTSFFQKAYNFTIARPWKGNLQRNDTFMCIRM